MIQFKDFVPEVKDKGGLLRSRKFANLQETVQLANAWLDREQVNVLNIETVVLPNIHSNHEEGSEDVEIGVGQHGGNWNQIVRVWFRNS